MATLDDYFNRAVAVFARGDYEAARSAFEKLTADHGVYYYRAADYLAQIAQHDGDLAQAERLLRLAAKGLNEADLFFRLGELLFQQRRMSDAEGAYRRAVAVDPGFTDAYIRLGMALRDREAVAEAIRAFELAIVNDPRAVAARYYLAQLCLRVDDQKRALSQLYFVLKLEPEYKPARLLMADVMQRMGDHRQALVEYCEVVALGTEDASVFQRMARSFQAIGDRIQSVRANERAFLLDPALGAAGLDAAREHEEMGHDERALAFYQRLVSNEEFRAAAQAAITRLEAKLSSFDLAGSDGHQAEADPDVVDFEPPPVQTASGTAPMRPGGFNSNELSQTGSIILEFDEPSSPTALDQFLRGMTDTIRRYVPDAALETIKQRVDQLDSLRQRIDLSALRRRFGNRP